MHLRDAQLITHVIEPELPAHHARVVYKLSETLNRRSPTGTDPEADALLKVAYESSLSKSADLDMTNLSIEDREAALDDAIYILWR